MRSAGIDKIVIETLHCATGLTNTNQQLVASPLYKQISAQIVRGFYTERLLIDLGDKLVGLAEHAYGLRQADALVKLSQTLLALPLPSQYESAARFFLALGLRRRGQHEVCKAVLERVAFEPEHMYSARALQSLGAVIQDFGDYELALQVYSEVGRAAEKGRLEPASIFAQKNFATIHGLKGDHQRAVAELERLSPFVRAIGPIHPHVYYDYLNSLAVELANVGRLEEAARTSKIAISSPFSAAYPEWKETYNEIALKQRRASHSIVAVRWATARTRRIEEPTSDNNNLVQLTRTSSKTEATALNPHVLPARVLNFQQWRIKSLSRTSPEGVPSEKRTRMTTGEKLIRLMDLISHDETDDETIDRILEAVEQIVVKSRTETLS